METITNIELALTSSAFAYGANIPEKYSCDGEDINPPLTIGNVPESAKSLALLLEDPDAPGGTYDHWVVWNIPADHLRIAENSVPGTEGANSFGKKSFGGPCPPDGRHRYFFRVYALNTELELDSSSDKSALLMAMDGKVLATGELMGTYTTKGMK